MFVQDGLTVDRTWETADGFLGFSARFARTGIQHYLGGQIDPNGIHKDADGKRRFQADALYPVQRDAAEVFAPRAMGSFIAKPLTNDHPSESVNVNNCGRLAKGAIGEVLRDGEYARMSGLFTDADTIRAYRSGKRELSAGYQTELVVGDGVNDKGESYVARQTMIDGNHVALVDKGRAGAECAIRDTIAVCDAIPSFLAKLNDQEKPVKTMLIDGLTVDISNADTAMATIQTILAARDAANAKVAGLETQVATLTTDKATLEAKATTLETQLADAKPTPAQLLDAAKAYQLTVDKAKSLGVTATDAMDEPAIKKAAVLAKLGDAAKEWTDVQFAASFDTLTAGMKVSDATRTVQPIGMPIGTTDTRSIRDAAAAARYN